MTHVTHLYLEVVGAGVPSQQIGRVGPRVVGTVRRRRTVRLDGRERGRRTIGDVVRSTVAIHAAWLKERSQVK